MSALIFIYLLLIDIFFFQSYRQMDDVECRLFSIKFEMSAINLRPLVFGIFKLERRRKLCGWKISW
jgi:hypothetical protein